MAVSRWSGEAMAEMQGVEHGLPKTTSSQIRSLAIENANKAGRNQVECEDVREALAMHFGIEDAEETDPPA